MASPFFWLLDLQSDLIWLLLWRAEGINCFFQMVTLHMLFLEITIMNNTHCKTAREIIYYIYWFLNAALNRCIWAVVIAVYWFTSRCKIIKLVHIHSQNKFREKSCTFLDALIFIVELSATEHHGHGATSGYSSLHHILFIYRCVFTETIINPGVTYLKFTSFLLLFQSKVGAFEKTVN